MTIFDQKYRHRNELSYRDFKDIFGNGMACGQRWQHGRTLILTLVFIRIALASYSCHHQPLHLWVVANQNQNQKRKCRFDSSTEFYLPENSSTGQHAWTSSATSYHTRGWWVAFYDFCKNVSFKRAFNLLFSGVLTKGTASCSPEAWRRGSRIHPSSFARP